MNPSIFLVVLLCSSVAFGKIYFEETFDDTWKERWTVSDWKKDSGEAGEWVHSAGKYFKDEDDDKGIKTKRDNRFFAISAPLTEEFSNEGKTLVLQFQVKHEQNIDCGGGYIKLFPGEFDPKTVSGDTPYSLMFGPDICGPTKRIQAIITHKGKNLLFKKTKECESDELSHVYTWIIKPDNTFEILLDGKSKSKGSLYKHWDFLLPKKIKDPSAKKPADWVDEEFLVDKEDKKPAGWDSIPAEIVDPVATKPSDWNEKEDGEWEAPTIPNPEYKGEWKPKKVKNPAYKGKWVAPEIDNPDFVEEKDVYLLPTLKAVGFELWQVKAGSIFDNILVTDDVDYAKEFRDGTWGKMRKVEKDKYEEDQISGGGDDDEKEEDSIDDEDADEKEPTEGHDEL